MNRPYLWCRRIGSWLVMLQVEPCEPAALNGAAPETDLDWDALAEQSGIPASLTGDGLQLCARCGQSVVPGDGRFFNRMKLSCFAVRLAAGFRYPAGAYLCAGCQCVLAEQTSSLSNSPIYLTEGVSHANQNNAVGHESRH